MKLLLARIRQAFDRNFVEREIEEELQFHLDLLTQKHVDEGRSMTEARKLAATRFGDVHAIKAKCAQIVRRNSLSLRVAKLLLVLQLIGGILIHNYAVERDVRRMGSLLIAIAILVRLLIYVRGLLPAKGLALRNKSSF
ncbi:MAG TPA: permease prefix domain 1-containing protein [Pyrinomonadaceae bacterium]|nr:permease prefix domain 1-containing protein [Pyrinomonadaceae bacterium]